MDVSFGISPEKSPYKRMNLKGVASPFWTHFEHGHRNAFKSPPPHRDANATLAAPPRDEFSFRFEALGAAAELGGA